MGTVFEKLIHDFSQQDGEKLLAACMSLDPKEAKKIPQRYRIIALGFIRKMTLTELYDKLASAGCEKLYARNYLEATLIYAFSNRMSYPQWKQLWEYCRREEMPVSEGILGGKGITYQNLREYVSSNSVTDEEEQYTRALTRMMESQISNLPDDIEKFRQYLKQNIHEFSSVREKTRYYFCKYLCAYIEDKILNYTEALEKGASTEDALADLMILKGITDLKRKKLTPDQAKELLHQASVSCGGIYDAFNYFYFEYISSDWMEVLLDYYGGSILDLPSNQKKQLADSLRCYRPDWKGQSDEEVLHRKKEEMEQKERELDQVYDLSGKARGYQKNRSGEKSVRNYIQGGLDIDRTTLLCYLIFFGQNPRLSAEQEITEKRLNHILCSCGFAPLQEERELDCFFIRYLQEEDPIDYLMEAVTESAFQNQNFFLYHMYNESVSNEQQAQKIFGK